MNGRLTRAILLVEDDDNDVVFMKRAMGKVGIEHLLRVTTNGQQAIDYFEGVGEFGDSRTVSSAKCRLVRSEAASRNGPGRAEMDPATPRAHDCRDCH